MRAIVFPGRFRRSRAAAAVPEGSRLLAAPTAELLVPADGQLDRAPRPFQSFEAPATQGPVMKTGERPYGDFAASQLAAYRAAAALGDSAARPAFDPAPGRAPETVPMAKLPGNVKVPPPPPAQVPTGVPVPARHAMAADEVSDLRLLHRVHSAMERKWRAESFIADKRELPCFAATTKAVGWLGMHMPSQPAGWRRWSTEPWAAREQELADAALRNARAVVLGELSDIRTRVDDSLHAAGGAA